MPVISEPSNTIRREEDSGGFGEISEGRVDWTQGFELRVDPSFWKDHNVQVIIRLRPLNSSEISLQGHNRCVRQDNYQAVTWTGHPESRFTFDLVADEQVSQERLFKVAGVRMVENCMEGYNSCMFAYGQTGSGKTHTMLGDIGGIQRNNANCGMTPRVFEYLFSRIHKEKETQSSQKLHFTCRCSFLEIYNEQILDLLDPSSSINLQIREDARRGVHVENLKEYEVLNPRDVIQLLIQGAANRKVASTNMNDASSRSHSVFTCVIERKWESQGVIHHRFARLNLVDLAGSERQKSSGAEGDRLKEATNINKSLSTLGLVIMNLVSSSGKRQPHVPYRDSKLTFLLQDSLGGNSKTMIIANISPSNCCALETLSTLKFAQRAKFIKNNAIVNEVASGDVFTLRLQIEQLKKELSHLRGLVRVVPDKLESDNITVSNQGSPAILKWNGDHTSSSPLTFDKRLSPRKEYEVALVAALRRIHDKEEEVKALTAERVAADQLIIQRTEKIKSLKLRLRFHEDTIRRLEALSSAKLSPETHVSQEREVLLKELEILHNQFDRNSETTRISRENTQLHQELKSLKSFVEDGEREMMNEQITVLQDKLLEALDWKLMHEKNAEDHPLFSWDSSVNEENELLRLEAIQNRREAESLQKNMKVCLEAKEMLERRVDELLLKLDEEQKKIDNLRQESQLPQTLDVISDDQMELKAMVDAIAAASQREAEAHETAITLARENEELHMKLKVLIADNRKLMDLHDESTEVKAGNLEDKKVENLEHQLCEMLEENEKLMGLYEEAMEELHDESTEVKAGNLEDKKVENLEHQLCEMLEENEKLMGLYEEAMEERDNFKRMLASYELASIESRHEVDCPEKLVEIDESRVFQEQNVREFTMEHVESELSEETLNEVRVKLDQIEEVVNFSCLVQKAANEVEMVYAEFEEREIVSGNKFFALKTALRSCSSNFCYWVERDAQAKIRYESSLANLERKHDELRILCALKNEKDASCVNAKYSEAELRSNIDQLKMQLQVTETQRKESEMVFLSLEGSSPSEWRPLTFGKATELLKSEEERTKISLEMKKLREKMVHVQQEMKKLHFEFESLDSKIKKVESEIKCESALLQESLLAWQRASGEKENICKMIEDGAMELGRILVDLQESIFHVDLKRGEIFLCEDELKLQMKEMGELRSTQKLAVENLRSLIADNMCNSALIDSVDFAKFASETAERPFGIALRSLADVKLLLSRGR
ncbi:Kinesin-like protein KIN12B [Platanthera zijinensis]|uniref:Kinesin-like protein KIN12B n=1 Tax=Platanthera zijinensis TaxID=2320716 RepID=A0AAP0C5Q1_9ASPA